MDGLVGGDFLRSALGEELALIEHHDALIEILAQNVRATRACAQRRKNLRSLGSRCPLRRSYRGFSCSSSGTNGNRSSGQANSLTNLIRQSVSYHFSSPIRRYLHDRGDLCLYGTAWWGSEDSNFQTNDYQRLALRLQMGPRRKYADGRRDTPLRYPLRNSSGSLTKVAAMRRASSLLSGCLAPDRRRGSVS